MTAGALVAGIGNILLADDGFGVEVACRLRQAPLGDNVRVEDFGVRAIHLAYELLEPYADVILIDALRRGERPGTVFVLEPDLDEPPAPAGEAAAGDLQPDGHTLDAASVLRLARVLGAPMGRVRVVGCEPAEIAPRIGLSAPVAAAVDETVRIVQSLLASRQGAGR